jgi:formylglycine-generating enzyme required for sulfatase activity
MQAVETLGHHGLRLPTEAEWEYGARGGTQTTWWTGDDRDSLIGAINLADQSAARANAPWSAIAAWPELDDGFAIHAPVGSYRPNPFGLHDVVGNVLEMCRDTYAKRSESEELRVDPVFLAEGALVIRGGSYMLAASGSTSAARTSCDKSDARTDCGVRPARSIEPR